MSTAEVLAKIHELRWVIGFLVVYFAVAAFIFLACFDNRKKENKSAQSEEMKNIDFSEEPSKW